MNQKRRCQNAFYGGAYTVAAIARYTALNVSRVRSWFQGRSDGLGKGPLIQRDHPADSSVFSAGFLDMIDVLVAGQFRAQGVKMSSVRAAYALLAKHLETQHPFCHNSLYTDGRSIFLYATKGLVDATLHEVVSRQQFFTHIRDRLTRVVYSEQTSLACKWNIADGVVIDPGICRGNPVVRETGVSTYVLANQYRANSRDAAFVADLFRTSETDVLNAVDFEDRFGGRRAA